MTTDDGNAKGGFVRLENKDVEDIDDDEDAVLRARGGTGSDIETAVLVSPPPPTTTTATPPTTTRLPRNDGGSSDDDEDEKREEEAEILFSSPAVYDPCIWVLLSIAPIATVAGIFFAFFHQAATAEDKHTAIRVCLWTTLLIIILFVFVLPASFEVLSNATVVVRTLPIKYKFVNATAAYSNPPLFEGWYRPRIKFATSLSHRVLVRRRFGGWDLLLSPADPEGFSRAVWKAAGKVENNSSVIKNVVDGTTGGGGGDHHHHDTATTAKH